MVKSILLSLFFILAARLGFAVETKPLRVIDSKLIFESKIESPNHLCVCAKKVWTFSVSRQSLYSLDLSSGAASKAYEFHPTQLIYGVAADISSLACREEHLLVTVNGSKKDEKAKILDFEIHNSALKLAPTQKYLVPTPGRVTDFFCQKKKCWMLQGKLFSTEDLIQWTEISIPHVQDVPKVNYRPDLNPFDDWQASLNIARNTYTKIAVSAAGQIAVMDPFHTKIVIQNGEKWEKWGTFGAWEGSFLSPKSVIFLDDNVMAVSDAKLKAVFLFSHLGKYLGIVSLGPKGAEKIFSPEYPLGLISSGGRLYIADFQAGKVLALDLSEFQSKIQITNEVSVRENLFRRPNVVNDHASALCLNCHDGTQSNQLYKFVKSTYHHPLECGKCHDPHHQVKARFYLQKSPEALCISCHQDYAKTETNHIFKSDKRGGACMDCHRSHAETPKLLLEQAPKICMDCHQNQSIHHRSLKILTENLSGTHRAQGIQLENGKMSCVTCHKTHLNWKSGKFLRERDQVRVFCASCHGVKTDNLYKNFHKIMKTKGPQP